MKTVSIFDLRDDLASYLTAVREERTTLVVRRFGKPIALITPYTADAVPNVEDYFGFLPKGERGSAFLSRRRRSDKEKKRTTSLRT